jgi:energy-coupling factor transport system ATP-binding protein
MGALAGAGVAFLVGGPGLAIQVLTSALFGFAVGTGLRRGWGRLRTLAFAAVTAWPIMAGTSVALLTVFANLRRLTLKQIAIGWRGMRHWLVRLHLGGSTDWGDHATRWVIHNWWIAIPLLQLAFVLGAVLITRNLSRPAVRRLDAALPRPGPPPPVPADAGSSPGPLPVRLEGVSVRYPGAAVDAIHRVSLTIEPATYTVVLGPNGSGKSTLGRVIAGMTPTAGAVHRPGSVAPGQAGGTASVFQRPESQVLGVRVADDLRWGLPAGRALDVDDLLATVGLAGFAERETATLSGGELQRLAIAAALARHPALLVSDESTTMLDPAGREAVAALLRRLPVEQGVAVVHITHHLEETRGADQVAVLEAGRLTAVGEVPVG